MPKLLPLLLLLCLTGCIGRQAYYLSPFNGVTRPYQTIPLQRDSVRSAFYAGGVLAAGTANDRAKDGVTAGIGRISHSLNFGRFQGFYGASLTLGSYHVKEFDSADLHETVKIDVINRSAGKKFFGGAGLDGGINYVVPTRKGEWRVLGLEGSVHNEFGQYRDFRDALPDTAATLVHRSKYFGTAGIYTEVVGYSGDYILGFKVGYGTNIGSTYHGNRIQDRFLSIDYIRFRYKTFTFHVTSDQWTGYLQANFARKASVFLFGCNFRLK